MLLQPTNHFRIMSGKGKGRDTTSCFSKVGLTFPVGRRTRFLRHGRRALHVSSGAPVHMASVLSYLTQQRAMVEDFDNNHVEQFQMFQFNTCDGTSDTESWDSAYREYQFVSDFYDSVNKNECKNQCPSQVKGSQLKSESVKHCGDEECSSTKLSCTPVVESFEEQKSHSINQDLNHKDNGADYDDSLFVWSNRFRRALDLSGVERSIALSNLAADFSDAVCSYGRVIICEQNLPKEQKSIPPVDMGGHAGGEKYMTGGILFKFAADFKGIYGNDEFAAKAAGHELKGAAAVFAATERLRSPCVSANIFNAREAFHMHVPLMAVLDVHGFRLHAVAALPIGHETLCYGSDNGGRDVVASDKTMATAMAALGQALHLKPHTLGRRARATVCGC